MNTRRTAIWLGSLFGGLLYLFILAAGPIWGASSPQKLRTCPQQAVGGMKKTPAAAASSATLFIPQG